MLLLLDSAFYAAALKQFYAPSIYMMHLDFISTMLFTLLINLRYPVLIFLKVIQNILNKYTIPIYWKLGLPSWLLCF